MIAEEPNATGRAPRVLAAINVVLAGIIAWEGLGGGLIMLRAGLDDPKLGTDTGWFLVSFYVVVLAVMAWATAAVVWRWRGRKVLQGVALVIGTFLVVTYWFGGA